MSKFSTLQSPERPGIRQTMPSATISALSVAPFPRAEVEKCLRDELVEAVKSEASIKGVALPAATAAVVTAPFQVDSLVVVSLLTAVEAIIGCKVPDNVVRAGGYTSVQQAMDLLLPSIEKHWHKMTGGKA